MTTKSQTHTTKWFFIIISVITLALFWKIVEPFALVLLTAGIVAIILAPLDTKLRKYLKSKKITALAMIIMVFVVILVPLFIGAAVMVDQASEIVQSSLAEDSWVREFNISDNSLILSLPEVAQAEIKNLDFVAIGKSAAEWTFTNIGNLFSSTAKLLFHIFIFFVALYYMLVDRERIHTLALELSPFKDTLDDKIVTRILNTVRSVVFGALIVAIVQGILAIIGLTIFGVPGSVLWGALVIIAAQVPMIGAALVLGPAVIYLAIIGQTGAAIGLLIWSVIVVGMIDNVLSPKLVGSKTKMHELLILISILGGLQVFGAIGFIVGPTVLAVVMVIVELYKSGILEDGK